MRRNALLAIAISLIGLFATTAGGVAQQPDDGKSQSPGMGMMGHGMMGPGMMGRGGMMGMMGGSCPMMGMMQGASPVERLDRNITAMEGRLQALKEVKPALAALYSALSDDQKKKADGLLTGMGCMM